MEKQGHHLQGRPEKNASVSITHSFVCEGKEKRAEGGGRRGPSERAIGLLTSRPWVSGLLLLSHEFLPRSFWEAPHLLLGVLAQMRWWWSSKGGFLPGKNEAEKWEGNWRTTCVM